jgi:hypothetical protein
MTYQEFLKNDYPDFYEAIDTIFSQWAKDIVFKSANEYANYMAITNGTGILPKQKDFLLQPAAINNEKKYRRYCTECKEPYMSYHDYDSVCPKCLPF